MSVPAPGAAAGSALSPCPCASLGSACSSQQQSLLWVHSKLLQAKTSPHFGGLRLWCSGSEGSSPGREDGHHCGEGTTREKLTGTEFAPDLWNISPVPPWCPVQRLTGRFGSWLSCFFSFFSPKTGLSGQHLPSSREFAVVWAVSWHQQRGSGHCQLSPSLVFLVAFQYLITFFIILLRSAVCWRLSELLEVLDVSVNTSIEAPSC